VLRRQTDHIKRLLDGLLDLSRMTHGKLVVDKERFDLVDLFRRQLRDDAEVWLSGEGVDLHWELPDARIEVDADPVRIRQVVDNLLSNAAKHTPAGGDVWVRVEPRGARVTIVVRDNGAGIPPALVPHVFEPFRQARDSKQASQGLGLGLSLVRAIVELHGGDIEVHSDGAGEGAELRVSLPMAAGPTPTRAAPVSRRPMEPLRFLLVEDNDDAAEMMAELLSRQGHRVTVTADAEEGLAQLASVAPDVVLCDISLEGEMSGYDLARAVRADARWRELPLLALTGYGSTEARSAALDSGFDAHLAKPVGRDVLLSAVQEVLARRGHG